jgi:hypothetical protein
MVGLVGEGGGLAQTKVQGAIDLGIRVLDI